MPLAVADVLADRTDQAVLDDVQVQVGDLWVRYAHLEAVLVGDGDVVGPGTVVGLEGSTGFSTGPHLHFEVRVKGALVDPLPLIARSAPASATVSQP